MGVDHWNTGTVDAALFAELHSGIDKGPDRTLLEYLARGGDPDLRNRTHGWTLLHAAAFKGRRTLVEALIQHEADIEALSPQDFTPLALAAHKGHVGCVRVLITAGASLACRPLGMRLLDSLEYAQCKSEEVRRVLTQAGAGSTTVQ